MNSLLLYQVSNQSRMMHFQRLIRDLVGRFSSCLGLSPMVIAFLVLHYLQDLLVFHIKEAR